MGNSVAKGAKGRSTTSAAGAKGRGQAARTTPSRTNGKPPARPETRGVAKPGTKGAPKAPASKAAPKPAPKASARAATTKSAPAKPVARKPAAPPKSSAAKTKPAPAKATPARSEARKAPSIGAKSTARSPKRTPAHKSHPAAADAARRGPSLPAPKKQTASAPRSPVVRPSVVVKAFEGALKYFYKGHFADARDAFEKVIKLYPDHTDIAARSSTYLAICRARTQSAPRLPQTPDTLYDRGVLELNRGNAEAAVGLFEKALKAQPDEAHILYSLAAALVRAGRVDDGLRTLERAIGRKEILRSKARTDPDFSSVRSEGRYRELVGGFWEAESY